MLWVLWSCEGRAGNPQHGLTPVPISTCHSCDRGDGLTGGFSSTGQGGCCGVWGRGTGVAGREGDGQRAPTPRVAVPSSPSPHIGGTSAFGVTNREAGC